MFMLRLRQAGFFSGRFGGFFWWRFFFLVINVLTVWPFLKKRWRKINYSSEPDIFSLTFFLETV